MESLNDARRKIEDRFGKISENLEIYMYEELFESMKSKKGIEKVNQNDRFIEIIAEQNCSNIDKKDSKLFRIFFKFL